MNQLSMANDLIDYAYGNEVSVKTPEDRVWRASLLVKHADAGTVGHLGESRAALCPFPRNLPYACLPSSCSKYAFLYKLVI